MAQHSVHKILIGVYASITSKEFENNSVRIVETLKPLYQDSEALLLCIAGRIELQLTQEMAALGLFHSEQIADKQSQIIYLKAIQKLASPSQEQWNFANKKLKNLSQFA